MSAINTMFRRILCLGVVLTAGFIMAVPAGAQEFPLTIEHKFGATIIEEKPQRVASVDTNGADNLLALGIQPVVIEYWYGDYERAVWPWAEPLLEETPIILQRGDLNFEQIAAGKPDVILSLWNRMTPEEYEKLSLIAPVVAMPEGVGDFELAWYDQALIAGRVVGREAEAQEQVAAIRARMQQIADAHPDWRGKTLSVASVNSDIPGAYTSADLRPQLLGELGFVNNPAIEAAIGDKPYYVKFSKEELAPFESDLLIWLSSSNDFAEIEALPNRAFLAAHKQGREVFLGKQMTGAFSHASLLSLPFALERIVPAIEAALDENPQTHADDR